MRHNISLLLGEDMKLLSSRLAKYIYKYGEGKIEEFCQVQSWAKKNGLVEIKKGELDPSSTSMFVSTTKDLYSTRLVDVATIDFRNFDMELRHHFTKLHQQTVTINNAGDSNRLLLTIFLPLYEADAYNQIVEYVNAINAIQANYSIVIIGFCSDCRNVIHPQSDDDEITPEQEAIFNDMQSKNINSLAALRLENNDIEHIIIIQNTNAAGYSLSLEDDSLVRIMGELSFLMVEKYDTIFTKAAEFDRDHPLCSIGLSVINLDKYYFINYLLRKSYLHLLEKEDVGADKVDLNKVAVVADKKLRKHKKLFSDFYTKYIVPLVRKGIEHDTIVSQTAPMLQQEIDDVTADLTDFINSDEFTLPEKKALLAVVLGYDDPLLKGNLFNQDQLTLDSLDAEVADIFISANNDWVKQANKGKKEEERINGPISVCCDKSGIVTLPVKRLQQLRNDMRESTNYIRQKTDELNAIEQMTQDADESEKRLTEEGFVIEGNLYHFDVEHQEAKFDETYVSKAVTENNVDLRSGFTSVKDQGQIGACTVFSISSIFEYILKKNSQKNYDLSESFVYYNVRHAEGNEKMDTGSSFQDVIKSIGTEGICTEELHPYSKKLNDVPSEEAYADGKTRRIVKALNVAITENDIKSAIQEGYPVAVSLKVYNSFSTTTFGGKGSRINSTGFVSYPSKSEISSGEFGYHAMVIVGFIDETKHFVVRNSWGKNFGDKGYCYIPYAYICDPELNRMACIVTEIDTSAEGNQRTIVEGRGSDRTIVKFNMNDAFIKSFVIQNLIDSEQRHLIKMQKEDLELRHEYETLMQDLGRQSKRKEILTLTQECLQKEIADTRNAQTAINETERPQSLRAFDQQTWKKRLTLIGWDVISALLWIVGWVSNEPKESDGGLVFVSGLINWIGTKPCLIISILLIIGIVVTFLYWWWIKTERRRIEMELEAKSASLAKKSQELRDKLTLSQLRFHVAGMVIDGLLTLKTNLDQKYNSIKSYNGNLAIWQKEEKRASADMEPLVKNPFIPLLSNFTLDNYFEKNVEEITGSLHLYEYFKGYTLNDDAIVAYKRKLKSNILNHITSLMNDFSIFRHVFKTKDYPYLDNTYASAENLLPLLDRKSEPFCQLRSNALTKPQARFLFINTDAQEKHAWKQEYPKYFNMTPISENICSMYKIVALRLQPLDTDDLTTNIINS